MAGSEIARIDGNGSAGGGESQLVFDPIADRLELETARQVESLEIVGRVQVEAEQRVVEHLHARVRGVRRAQVGREAVGTELRLDDVRWREQQSIGARARVGRRR